MSGLSLPLTLPRDCFFLKVVFLRVTPLINEGNLVTELLDRDI